MAACYRLSDSIYRYPGDGLNGKYRLQLSAEAYAEIRAKVIEANMHRLVDGGEGFEKIDLDGFVVFETYGS